MKKMNRSLVRVGLPKGRLRPYSEQFAQMYDISLPTGGSVHAVYPDKGMEIFLCKPSDIISFVDSGLFDVGLVPREWIENFKGDLPKLREMPGYNVRVCLIGLKLGHAQSKKNPIIVSEFPHVARKFISKHMPGASLLEIKGSSEAFVPSIADFAIDTVETGQTLEANGLCVLEEIFSCQMHLVVNPEVYQHLITQTHFEKYDPSQIFSILCERNNILSGSEYVDLAEIA